MFNKEIVKAVLEAFLAKDIEKVIGFMAEDVQVGWPGFFDLAHGKKAVREFFSDIPEIVSGKVGELVAEGDTVVGNGMVTSRNADGTLRNSFFSDWYQVENGKVKSIKSYMVFENSKQA